MNNEFQSTLALANLSAATISNLTKLPSVSKLATQSMAILGLGREGLSSFRFLRQLFPEAILVIGDAQPLEKLDPEWAKIIATQPATKFVQLRPQPWTEICEVAVQTVFRTPGLAATDLDSYNFDAQVVFSSNTQLCLQIVKELNSPQLHVIGVTGTKGKSTTTALIHHVLQAGQVTSFLGGNIGRPPLEVLSQALMSENSSAHLVLELSSHQLADLTISPELAVIQDIQPEHLDYYQSFTAYQAAKANITRFQHHSDYVIFNADSAAATATAELSAGHKLSFALQTNDSICTATMTQILYQEQPVVSVSQLKLPGRHNLYNVMPAVIIGQHLSIPLPVIGQALTTFAGLPHRLEFVTEQNGLSYYNDSLATTPEATMAALAAFADRPIVLIAGGYDRGLDFTRLGLALMTSTVSALVLFAPSGEKILAALPKSAGIPAHFVNSMTEAVAKAQELAQPGSVILLSPASASFGSFKDYADRGQQFAAAIS